jgi:site-specific recombinase XerD
MKTDLVTLSTSNQEIADLVNHDPQLRSDHTKRQYRSILGGFEAWRAGRPMSKSLVELFASELQEQGRAPRTINQKLAAIRWWGRKIDDLIQDMPDPSPELQSMAKQALRVASVRDVKGTIPERGRHISLGELAALLEVCTADPTPAGARDAALFALAWATGARRDELAKIELQDVTQSPDEPEILDILIQHGKGGRSRKVFVNNGAVKYLADWLAIRGDAPGALFVTIRKNGVIIGGNLSAQDLGLILAKRTHQTGISQHTTMHDFRRTFAGSLFEAGIDGALIMRLLGHSSLDQTGRYDRRPEDNRRQAIKVLHVPYFGKS